MGNWIIRWNFNKESYAPGESALISLWLENTDDTYLYVSKLELEFDFGIYGLVIASGMVPQRTNKFLGNVNLLLPEDVVGRKIFRPKYRIHEYIDNNWLDLGAYTSDRQYSISVYPRPFYQVFVSRGLRTEDRAIGDSIAEMIREWGFKTVTVGIEKKVPEEQVFSQVREEIRRTSAVIVIATPRFKDSLTGLWKTLEWAHNEVGIAFGIDKPLLILKDKNVSIGGLPSYLADSNYAPLIEFNPFDMDELRNGLPAIMPEFRDWIENRRRQDFNDNLSKIVVNGLAVVGGVVIVNGVMGALAGTSKK